MEAQPKLIDDKAERLLAVARDIIRERGDFDLPMRELAARARVSLRSPYELFGSKTGVIRAILKADQLAYRERVRKLASRGDPLEELFSALHLGVDFFAENQPFYRALFRATQAYSGGDEPEPARENVHRFEVICRRAAADGVLDRDVAPDVLAESLLDVFAANVRVWATTGCDLRLTEARIGFGWSVLLAGSASGGHAQGLRARAVEFQRMIRGLQAAEAEALAPARA